MPQVKTARYRPPLKQTAQSAHIPAPVGGINTASAGTVLPNTDAVDIVNAVATTMGLRARRGWTTYATGIGPDGTGKVRGIHPFKGSAEDGSQDRLFVTSTDGIWDVTDPTSVSLVMAYALQGGVAGWAQSTAYTTVGGHFLILTDERNGYYLYTESTDTWTKPAAGASPGQINGTDPATFVNVVAWKNRLWFTKRDTAEAWYTDVGAITGDVTRFDFGNKAKSGGNLVGLWSWTIDGGAGVDDHLVGVISGGDLIVYKGTDPDTAGKFEQVGVWTLGALPAGRRIATEYGGDLLFLCTRGVLAISKLISGDEMLSDDKYATAKIANMFTQLANERRTEKGWSISIQPEDNVLLITIPKIGLEPYGQLAMSFSTRGWSKYRDLPIISHGVWRGKYYYGTEGGTVCLHSGDLDNGNAIYCGVLTAYQSGNSQRMKRVQLIRPTFASQLSMPLHNARARYDFEVVALPDPDSPGGLSAIYGRWDETNWDEAVWADEHVALTPWGGNVGCGVNVAIEVQWESASRASLVSIDVTADYGGLL